MSASDADEQTDEAASLEAIFGDDAEFDSGLHTYRVYLPSKSCEPHAVLRVLLPPTYPSSAGPVMELEAAHVPEQQLAAAVKHMEDMFTPGQVCLFDCIEWLREQLQQWQDEAAAAAAAAELAAAAEQQLGVGSSDGDDDAASEEDDDLDAALQHLPEVSTSQPRERGYSAAADQALIERMRPRIISGEPFTERKSTFQAHVAPTTHVDEVQAVVAILLENNKIRHATHPAILAYRIAVPNKPGVFHQDYDDDGEAAAGGRLLHLLQAADVRNAVVVVSRWFGGILLGPARFGLINNTARQLLEQTGFIQQASTAGGKQGAKKHRKRH